MTHPDTLQIPRAVVEQALGRAEFEQWYACNAFNFERDPIGSRDCGLQWTAWQASRAALQPQAASPVTDAPDLPEPVGVVLGFEDDSGMAMVDHSSEIGPALAEKQCVYSGDQMEQRWFQGFLAGKSRSATPNSECIGWQMVPIEPTPEMLSAVSEKPHPTRPDGWSDRHAKMYKGMLRAAPPLTGSHPTAEPIAEVLYSKSRGYLQFGRPGSLRIDDEDKAAGFSIVALYTQPLVTQSAAQSIYADVVNGLRVPSSRMNRLEFLLRQALKADLSIYLENSIRTELNMALVGEQP